MPSHALVATNTSGLSVTALADATTDPGRLIGLHFFNPASTMRLIEVIAGADDIDLAMRLGAGWTNGPLAGA